MAPPTLLALVLSAGMAATDLVATLEKLKESSKKIGGHKLRQLYWDAYGKMASKANGLDDGAHVFLKYSASEDGAPDSGRNCWIVLAMSSIAF
jgi:hypothetical protein